ncbi:uncharacterized protein LOC125036801 [Penaeus chinensis]|uniref:uncharacterized protein LOC125036801 n=1 Tax=Penaeus chinensis TaxID=139456 RepID=UPI001FB75498|nr:uncharacterized protein LOC125036801 [Penaeus chinensis]
MAVATPNFTVPKRVANRMVPSWWFTAKRVCYGGYDCSREECCTRPMLSSNSYCMSMRTRGQVCNTRPQLLDPENELYFNDCPCLPNFSCAALNHKTAATCVDTKSLEVDFRKYKNSFLSNKFTR